MHCSKEQPRGEFPACPLGSYHNEECSALQDSQEGNPLCVLGSYHNEEGTAPGQRLQIHSIYRSEPRKPFKMFEENIHITPSPCPSLSLYLSLSFSLLPPLSLSSPLLSPTLFFSLSPTLVFSFPLSLPLCLLPSLPPLLLALPHPLSLLFPILSLFLTPIPICRYLSSSLSFPSSLFSPG